MCGIIAIIGPQIKTRASHADRMLATLRQRGPDSARTQLVGSCILGQARLSIVDIEGGVQPMSDADLPITLVFNGEIYNFQQVQAELKTLGHHFKTRSDTEVVLRAYIQWGHSCVDHIEGMFAFAIWDGRSKEVFLARDHFGKKPLYYTQLPDKTFLIASEIKALFATGLVKGEISTSALESYLALLYVLPDQTIYENISTLPPAHCATITQDSTYSQRRYWHMPIAPVSDSYETAKSKIRSLLTKAVQSRMVVDVEIGSFLSGGVDSTFVSLIAAQQKKQIKTFSLGYADGFNELPYALQAARAIGSDHHAFEIKEDTADELLSIIKYMDEPHADSSSFPQHLLSKRAAKHVRVALSGDGADEFFMGYGWYWKHAHEPFIKRWLNRIISNPFAAFIQRMQVFSQSERADLLLKTPAAPINIIPEHIAKAPLSALQKISLWTSQVYLPGLLLTKIDRTSMMHSLEVRSPFLDRSLTEYVFNLPTEYKCNVKNGEGKIILKDLLTEHMPNEFVYRRKEGFGAPISTWLSTHRFQTLISTVLLDKHNPMFRYIKYDTCKRIVETYNAHKHSNKTTTADVQLWSLLCLSVWFKEHAAHHE